MNKKRIGQIIERAAIILSLLILLGSFIIGVLLSSSSVNPLIGFAIIIFGVILSIISFLLLAGFGHLIQSVDNIELLLTIQKEKEALKEKKDQ